MKNKKIWLVILVLTLVFGMSVIGCEESSDNTTKFEGRWLNLSAVNDNGFTDFSYTFTDNKFSFISVGTGNTSYSGTFTFTDTQIRFIVPAESWDWSQEYTLNGNVLTLEQYSTVPYGAFTKQ